jgi:hypothetical protein
MWMSGLVGVNASQATLTSSSATAVSNGYAGYALGAGLSYSPMPMTAGEVDLIYSERKFGFNSTKNSFPTIQVPVFVNYRLMQFYAGAGAYGALWKFDGELVKGSKTSDISPTDAGQAALEMGFALNAGLNMVVKGLPLRFDFRRFQSLNDVASSSSLKGKIVEYQVLVGYNLGVGGK